MRIGYSRGIIATSTCFRLGNRCNSALDFFFEMYHTCWFDHWWIDWSARRFVWIDCWVNPAPVKKWLVGWMFSSSHSGPSNGSRNPFVTWVLLQGLLYLGGDAESIRKPCPKDLMVTLVTVASRIWGWRKVKSSTNGSFSIAICHYQRATARFGFLTCLLIHHD